jgi:lipopolysaccharide export system protein LptA
MTAKRLLAATAALLPLLLFPAGARAQAADPTSALGLSDSDVPVEVEADNALEWQRESHAYVARGNAVARRGDVSVTADMLIAYYRDKPGGGTEVWRVAANGHVHIASPGNDVYGDNGVYDISRQVAVLTGQNLRLVTPTDRITARDSLEYWQAQRIAVARGNAEASRGDNLLQADKMTAHFGTGADGKLDLETITADGQVVATTPDNVARGDHAEFNVKTNIATLTGNVRLTQNGTQLAGETVEVDMNTGVSRLRAAPAGTEGGGRVRVTIDPGQGIRLGPAPTEGGGE